MDFGLTQLQRRWQERCRGFARDVIRPQAAAAEAAEQVPRALLRDAQRRGLYGPELLGEVASDPQGLLPAIYMEELAWGSAGVAIAMGAATGVVGALVGQGTPEQVQRWLPRCYADEQGPRLAAWAQTEPAAGSDASALALRARFEQGAWTLEGDKSLVGNGDVAAVTMVVASVDPRLGARGQAHFVVPEGTGGVAVRRVNSKMGLRAGRLVDLRFRGCRLTEEALLGGRERLDERLRRARRAAHKPSPPAAATELGRALMGAVAVGVGRAALEEATSRPHFEGIAGEQYCRHRIADAATELDAARMLVWRAAWMARSEVPFSRREGSMAKLKASDVAMSIASQMMELLGREAGSERGLPGRLFRDAKAFQLMEGTNEIQREAVGRAVVT